MKIEISKMNNFIDRIAALETNMGKAFFILGNILEDYFCGDDQKIREKLAIEFRILQQYLEISTDYIIPTMDELKVIIEESCKEVDKLKKVEERGVA